MSMPGPMLVHLVRRIEGAISLTEAERAALTDLPVTMRHYETGQSIAHERDRPTQCCVVLGGTLCRQKEVTSGRRQILSLHIPGDVPDAQGLHLDVLDYTLGALADATVGLIGHEPMRRMFLAFPRLGSAFWRETLIDAAIGREWMVGLGRRDARTRVAHFVCEYFLRMQAVGLTDDEAWSCSLPIPQTDLADVLGLSAVHVNRVLQKLRREKLIALARGKLTILDWVRLKAAGEFDPTYLQQIAKTAPQP